MSLCADCGATSVLGVTEGGVTRTLCPACADSRAGIPALSGLVRSLRRPRRRNGVCPYCGTTAEQATETGIVGCPLCYEALRGALDAADSLEKSEHGSDLW